MLSELSLTRMVHSAALYSPTSIFSQTERGRFVCKMYPHSAGFSYSHVVLNRFWFQCDILLALVAFLVAYFETAMLRDVPDKNTDNCDV